jgi:hypothetical protein
MSTVTPVAPVAPVAPSSCTPSASPSSCTPSARYALICYHDPDTGPASIEVTRWPTRQEAQQVSKECFPCGPRCIGVHTVVYVDQPPRDPHRTDKIEAKR